MRETPNTDFTSAIRIADLPATSVDGRPPRPVERVSANRRIVFRFVNGEAVDVDLVDYH